MFLIAIVFMFSTLYVLIFFTLKLNPSLGKVSFKGINLKIEDDKTISTLPHYFMKMDNIKFIKE
jgi:hypothetical protein